MIYYASEAIALTYCCSTAFTAAACWSGIRAMQAGNFAKTLKEGVHSQDIIDLETRYAAIVCKNINTNPSVMLPPDNKSVLLGRARILESSINVGTGPTMGRSGGVAVTFTSHTTGMVFGFPEHARFSANTGSVVANHLDLAAWDGFEKEKKNCTFQEIAPVLRDLGVRSLNQLADSYAIERHWFTGEEITIFADCVKKGTLVEVNPPKGKSPFIVTKQDPEAYAEQAEKKAARIGNRAKILAACAAALGLGAYAANEKVKGIDHGYAHWTEIFK